MRLVLASASPRRAELLTTAGYRFEVRSADVDETPHPGEAPDAYALRVARHKAAKVADELGNFGGCVLAADTVVVAGARTLGKPRDEADARQMLQLLSGAVHDVFTAVVVRQGREEAAETVLTRVRFLPLTSAEIEWYIRTGEPDGKAGGYAIQGRASRFVDRIEGSWSNVVGLPVATVYRMLGRAGVLC
jgi:septum formation protein